MGEVWGKMPGDERMRPELDVTQVLFTVPIKLIEQIAQPLLGSQWCASGMSKVRLCEACRQVPSRFTTSKG